MKKIQPNIYYNLLPPAEGDTEATIMIYAYIGEWWTWDPEEGYTQSGVTDIEFTKDLEELSKQYAVIHIRINSMGGEIFHGAAIFNAIRNCPAEVHTWNDGVCASMAAIIWMAGKKRHMAKNALLMLHSASAICWGNAADMRNMAEMLDQFDSSLIIGAADAVGATEEELRTNYFDGKDHWLNFNDVQTLGWMSQEDNYPSANPLPIPENKALNYRELLLEYEQKARAQMAPSAPKNELPEWLRKTREIFEDAKTAIREILDPSTNNNNDSEMKFEDFTTSISDGTLSLDQVKAHLESLQPPPPVAPADPAASEEVVALQTRIADLEKKVLDLGAQPGASRSNPALPDTDAPGAPAQNSLEAQLKAFNDATIAAANANEPAAFVIN